MEQCARPKSVTVPLTGHFFCAIVYLLVRQLPNHQHQSTLAIFTMFIKVERPCGIPDVQHWEKNCKIPEFRTLEVIGFEATDTAKIINKNEDGQLLNPAREQGIDFQNVNAIQLSYINQGFDTTKVPPIVLDTGESIDGNTRIEASRNIEQQHIVVLRCKLRPGFSIEDAFDEIGLGLNNHLSCKRMTKGDCEKRLALFFKRTGFESKQKGIEWFTTFDHSWSKDDVKTMVDKVINKKRFEDTMSPFNAKSATKWLSEKGHESDVVTLNWKKSKSSSETYLLRAFKQVLTHFGETSEIKPVTAYVSGYDAESVESARREAERELKILNKALNNLAVKIKEAHAKGEDFELMKLNGWIPQVTNVENDLVPPQ